MKTFPRALGLLRSGNDLWQALRLPAKTIGSNREHVQAACEWLLHAQAIAGGGGYAHSYNLYLGWQPPYPETTGYIIPSLLSAARYLRDERYHDSAIRAGEWLIGIQQEDGAFLDLNGQRQVFDTGQILEGLLALYRETARSTYLHSATRAGEFLVAVQDSGGSWTRCAYNGLPHTYYTRVAANLLKLWKETDRVEYRRAAERAIGWTVRQQMSNGYFAYMAFGEGELPYLHTIIYVLEGLFEATRINHDPEVRAALLRTVNALYAASSRDDGVLCSRYDSNWQAHGGDRCLVGLAQWAGLLFDLADAEDKPAWSALGRRVVDYLKQRQVRAGRGNMHGAIPGSDPLWGSYCKFAFTNWTVKFFIDAVLKAEGVFRKHGGAADAVSLASRVGGEDGNT